MQAPDGFDLLFPSSGAPWLSTGPQKYAVGTAPRVGRCAAARDTSCGRNRSRHLLCRVWTTSTLTPTLRTSGDLDDPLGRSAAHERKTHLDAVHVVVTTFWAIATCKRCDRTRK